jgi:hypothetical protein
MNASSSNDLLTDFKQYSRLSSPPAHVSLFNATSERVSQSASLTLKTLLLKEKQSMLNVASSHNHTAPSVTTSTSTTPHCFSEPASPPSTINTALQQQSDISLSNEPLNTNDVSQKVRDLLNVHNIGQRIFAKYILGLSQGTVSELLSKPKHWDKLTEKGRESYRKMYTWSCSDKSINALKAVSPRKGNKEAYFYQNGKEDSATEERIVQILNEAQKQMQVKAPSGNSFDANMVC